MPVKKWYIKTLDGKDYIFADAYIANPMDPNKREKLSFLVDTGAFGCAIPEDVALKLNLDLKGYVDAGLAYGTVKKNVKATYILIELAGRKVYTWTVYDVGFEPILGIDVMRVLGAHLDVPAKQILTPPPFKMFNVKHISLYMGFLLKSQ